MLGLVWVLILVTFLHTFKTRITQYETSYLHVFQHLFYPVIFQNPLYLGLKRSLFSHIQFYRFTTRRTKDTILMFGRFFHTRKKLLHPRQIKNK